jgi:hypothetical protein
LRASVRRLEYVGNGSADGPFVYCGFKPALVIIKTTSGGVGLLKIVQEVQIIQMVLNYMQIHLLLMMTLMVLTDFFQMDLKLEETDPNQ